MSRIFVSGYGAVSPAGWSAAEMQKVLAAGKPLPVQPLERLEEALGMGHVETGAVVLHDVLGTAGALRWFEPVQPILSIAGLLLLGWALRVRLRAERACPMPSRAGSGPQVQESPLDSDLSGR